jgi:hypothetical protein
MHSKKRWRSNMARTSEKFSLSYLCSRLTTIALNCLPRSSFLGRLLINRVPFHSVFLLNDDYTPMDFVVHVLEHFFDMDSETAMATMLRIHNEGAAECGFYPRPEAEPAIHCNAATLPLVIQTQPALSLPKPLADVTKPLLKLAPSATDPKPPSRAHPTIRRRNRLPDCIVDRVSVFNR